MSEIAIPLIVTAKNEEASLGPCLRSLLVAEGHARRHGVEISMLVVADDCTDGTAEIAQSLGVPVIAASGGKVEAQRTGLAHATKTVPTPFAIFSDADILVEPTTLSTLVRAMDPPHVRVAFPDKEPLPPRRETTLARAIHTYNRRRGFSTQRTWFSGKLFAMRGWHVPLPEELCARAATLPADPFLDLASPMRVDDIFLSRMVVAEGGVAALAPCDTLIRYRAPETWLGMLHVYRRMRRELERMDVLFPEHRAVGQRHGRRRYDALPRRPGRELLDAGVFAAALAGCKLAYRAERATTRWLGVQWNPWPKVGETRL